MLKNNPRKNMIFKKYKAEVHLQEYIKREAQLGIEKYFIL